MPFVLEKIELLKPRYIMNVAIRDPATWFMFCYRGQRFAYDSKWFPQKPSDSSDPVGIQLSILKEEERDQVSHCAFGESNDCYFLRSTDILYKWHPKFSNNVPMHLLSAYQDEAFRRHPRAVTFGKNQTWILYGKDTFEWSKRGLPKSLQAALQKGKKRKWVINVRPYLSFTYVPLIITDVLESCFEPPKWSGVCPRIRSWSSILLFSPGVRGNVSGCHSRVERRNASIWEISGA